MGQKLSSLCILLMIIVGCSSNGTRTIRSSVKSIKESNFDSVVIEQAVTTIWKVLQEEYPEPEYTRSYTCEELLFELPEALREHKPFLIAFAPDTVFSRGNSWTWTTHFLELAGHGILMETMTPNIYTPGGHVYYFPSGSNKMTHGVRVGAFGSGHYEWWCNGDFSGSSVSLYFGDGVVTAYTLLYNPSAITVPAEELPPPARNE